MSFINVTQPTNGLLFDLSNRDGAGTAVAKYIFRPNNSRITRVDVFDDRMVYYTIEGRFFLFSYNGVDYSKLKVAGIEGTDNYDLFNKFIAIL